MINNFVMDLGKYQVLSRSREKRDFDVGHGADCRYLDICVDIEGTWTNTSTL